MSGASPALGQVGGAATMDGRVVDATESVLPGVSVTVTNTATGYTRAEVTSSIARFIFPRLPVGPYRLTAELDGFQTLRMDGLILTVGAVQSLGDLTLEVATVEEVVNVTAQSPLIETGRPVVATTFNQRAVENLPIRGRDFKAYALSSPTVVPIIDSGRNTVSIGGMKGIDTNLTVDGADFNNSFWGSATGQPEVPYFVVSQEAVQEFQVLSNGYSAEFGRSGGGFLNVVTKSGTNEFRGSAFYFGRSDELRSQITDIDGDPLSHDGFSLRQYGGSLGGPIVKDRAQFFLALDQQGFDRPKRIKFSRDVSGVCNSDIYGMPIAGVDCLADEEGDIAELLDNTAVLGKVDIQLDTNNRLSLRYNYSTYLGDPFFTNTGGSPGLIAPRASNNLLRENNTAHSFVATNTTVVGANKLNELRFQYSYDERPRRGQSDDLPTVEIFDTGKFGREWWLPIDSEHERIQLTNNFTYLFGDHDLKIGGDLNLTETNQGFFGWSGGHYQFQSLEDYIDDNPLFFRQRVGLNGFDTRESGTFPLGQQELALYIQDTWRPRPGLTLNFGLRWGRALERRRPGDAKRKAVAKPGGSRPRYHRARSR